MGLKDIVICSVCESEDSLNIARKAADYLKKNYGVNSPNIKETINPDVFSGGEINPKVLSNLEGKNVYIFGVPTNPANILNDVSPGEMKTRAEFFAYLAKSHGADKTIFVPTNLFFNRADKDEKDIPDDAPIEKKDSFKGKANLAKAQAIGFKAYGIDQILTMHVHSDEVHKSYESVYEKKDALIELNPAPLLVHYLINYSLLNLKNKGEDIIFQRPDLGADRFVSEVYNYMHQLGYTNISRINLEKLRKVENDPQFVELVNPTHSDNFKGTKGKVVITLDDLDDTSGTKFKNFNTLKVKGIKFPGDLKLYKADEVASYATHAVLAGLQYENAMRRIASHKPIEIIYTNSHPQIENNMIYYLRKVASVIRIGNYFGEAIRCLEERIPIKDSYLTDGLIDHKKISKFSVAPFRRSEHSNSIGNY